MPTLPTLPTLPTPAPSGGNRFSYHYSRQLASLIRSVRDPKGRDAGDPAAPYVSSPSFQYNWARFPAMPPAGETSDILKIPDETLTYYAEQYLLYVAPWEHLVGTLIPNFYQFIAWHEHAAPVDAGPLDDLTGKPAVPVSPWTGFGGRTSPGAMPRDLVEVRLSSGKTLFRSAREQALKILELIQ